MKSLGHYITVSGHKNIVFLVFASTYSKQLVTFMGSSFLAFFSGHLFQSKWYSLEEISFYLIK